MAHRSQRADEILAFLGEKGFSTVNDIARTIGVSSMTTRRALQRLEGAGLVKLVHGGAMPAGAFREAPYSLIAEECHRSEEKARIGAKAATLIAPGDTILIDSGTTTEYLARSIADDLPVTVVCYTLNVLFELYRKKETRVIFAGGYYHENTMMFECAESRQFMRKLRTVKAFLGATGVHHRFGVTCSNPCEPDVKRTAMESSMTRILLVDSSKFGLIRPFHFAELDQFEAVVTDRGIPREYAEALERAGKVLHVT